MKAIQINNTGGAEVLLVRDVPEPIPSNGEVLIRVDAAEVNFSDITWRRGEYDVETPLPFIPGAEVSRTVVALGPNVTGFSIGCVADAHRLIESRDSTAKIVLRPWIEG